MSQIKTIVLFGGTSSERFVSVASAQNIATILSHAELWYWSFGGEVMKVTREELLAHSNPFDMEFKPANPRHVATSIEDAILQVSQEVVYLALHGGSGENGWLQAKLEARKIYFTGSSSSSSALAMDKSKSKLAVQPRGVLVAKQCLFSPIERGGMDSLKAFYDQQQDIVIKPASDGSSSGLSFIKTKEECQNWIQQHANNQSTWLAEERISGRELTVGVIMHKGCLTVLTPSEVVLERNAHFDYQAKYHGVGNREITPAEVTVNQASAAQALSVLAHAALGCFGYTRTDMIMNEKGIYYLETNTLPGMTKASFIPQQLQAAGIPILDFVVGQIELAKKRYE